MKTSENLKSSLQNVKMSCQGIKAYLKETVWPDLKGAERLWYQYNSIIDKNFSTHNFLLADVFVCT